MAALPLSAIVVGAPPRGGAPSWVREDNSADHAELLAFFSLLADRQAGSCHPQPDGSPRPGIFKTALAGIMPAKYQARKQKLASVLRARKAVL